MTDVSAPAFAPVAGIPRVAVNPFDEAVLADPYPFHVALRDVGPVFWLDTLGCYGAARHAEVTTALSDWRTFCSSRGVGIQDYAHEEPWRPPSLLLETDPPEHDRARAIIGKVMSPSALKLARPIWRARANALIDDLVRRRRFDAITDLAEVYPMQVFPDTIGIPVEGREHLLAYAAGVFNAFGPRNAVYQSTAGAMPAASAWVASACRRENLSEDGWGMAMFRSVDEGLCTEDEAERLIRTFLSAGLDTTINGIGNMMLAFATFPDQWLRLRQNRDLKKRAFEESLRWDSTVQTFFRTSACKAELGGTTIPADAKLLLFLAAANRDPRRWDDPDVFDISRVTSGHVGFGFGVHQCVGQMVARMEAEIVLDALIDRVAEISLVGEPVRRLNNSLHALASLPLAFVPA